MERKERKRGNKHSIFLTYSLSYLRRKCHHIWKPYSISQSKNVQMFCIRKFWMLIIVGGVRDEE